MSPVLQQLNETVNFILQQYKVRPEVGIVLGSGLGKFAAEIDVELEISYSSIPNFPVSTVEGHQGKLIFGKLQTRQVVAMAGRFHFYEGYSSDAVVFPIRVMKLLGIQLLLISNAAGGVHPSFNVGDLMIIRDHLSFATVNPLIGKNIDELGPRFPDMSEPYNKALIRQGKKIAADLDIKVQEGVYFGVTGPTFETRAEYKMIRLLGGDAVGMSTVQEVITAAHLSLPVFAISIITDIGIREEENIITHKEVLEAAANAEPQLSAIFRGMIASFANEN